MSMQSQDIVKRSAASVLTPAPHVRDKKAEVAKLIDVTTCIGCKACQVACSEWNDIRDEVGHNHGMYDNPIDLTADSWTVMRFDEYQNDETRRLEWLIRKHGCMHCADPGCLKACPPPGAHAQCANGIAIDLTVDSWTVMRFDEYQNDETGRVEWLIRKDGCMHCADPGCLKACPQPGAMVQYANGIVDFQSEHCIGCGYCIAGCPFDV